MSQDEIKKKLEEHVEKNNSLYSFLPSIYSKYYRGKIDDYKFEIISQRGGFMLPIITGVIIENSIFIEMELSKYFKQRVLIGYFRIVLIIIVSVAFFSFSNENGLDINYFGILILLLFLCLLSPFVIKIAFHREKEYLRKLFNGTIKNQSF